MSHDRRTQARNIALGYRSLPEPLRAPFLDRVCAGDAELRAEVEGLLAPEAPSPFAAPPAPVTPPPLAASPPAPASAPPPPVAPDETEWVLEALDERDFLERTPVAPAEPGLQRRSSWRTVLLVAAAGGILWLAWLAVAASTQSARLVRERDLARGQESEARRESVVRARIADALAAILETPGWEGAAGDRVTLRAILDRGAARVRRELGDDPGVQARVLATLGDAYAAIGDFGRADSLRTESLRIWERLRAAGGSASTTDATTLARLHRRRREYDTALSLYRDALAAERARIGERHPRYAALLDETAGLQWERGRFAEAESLTRRSLEIYSRLYPRGHPSIVLAGEHLARDLRSEGDLEEAERVARETLVLAERVLRGDDPLYASQVHGLGEVLVEAGRTGEAEPLLRRALALRRRLYGEEHPAVAEAYESLGRLELRRERPWSAEQQFTRARAIREVVQSADREEQAFPLLGLARVALLRGDAAAASPLAERATAILVTALGEHHPLTEEAVSLALECRRGATAEEDRATP